MENKGCFWIIAVIIAIFAIGNCNNKKTSTSTTSSTRTESNFSNSNKSSNNHSSSSFTHPREKSEIERLLEIYQNNSLANGSQPYSSIYGTNTTNGNSEIVVNAPSNQDVLVIIKRGNANGNVERHAYIAKGYSYTFHLPAGTYQPFFYGGDSWCPTKKMSKTVIGGFLQHESFSKDYPQKLEEYTQLTYSLTATINGNFSTKSSSEEEIF